MVSELDSRSKGPGSSPGGVIVFLDKTLYSRRGGGGGDSIYKKVGMLVKNFEIDP